MNAADFRYLRRPAISRRCFVEAGALGALGLSLPQWLRSPALAAETSRAKGAILIWLGGGPSHHDTFDPKPDAPAEIRGQYGTMATAVPGIHFAESLPRLAEQANRLAVIRTLTHRQSAHEPGSAFMMTGYEFRPGHNYPSAGSVMGYQRRGESADLPPYLALPNETIRGGGHLGAAFHPLSIPGDPNQPDFRVRDLTLPQGLGEERFLRRRELAAGLSDGFRQTRPGETTQTIDAYAQQAYDLILSQTARTALDLTLENDRERERYGRSAVGQRLLLARRLIEAGVPFITVTDGDWDHHRDMYPRLGEKLPAVDQGVARLIEDLHERGRLNETLIIMMGEFGRTPKINESDGRDHWSQCFSVMLAGGGVRGGQVIGASDAEGAQPLERPVTPQDLLVSIYRLLGLDPEEFLPTNSGRDVQIVAGGHFIDELRT